MDEWLELINARAASKSTVFSIPGLVMRVESYSPSLAAVVYVNLVSEFSGPLGVTVAVDLYAFLRATADAYVDEVKARHKKAQSLWQSGTHKVKGINLFRNLKSLQRSASTSADEADAKAAANKKKREGDDEEAVAAAVARAERVFHTKQFVFAPDIRLTAYQAGAS